MFGGKPAFGVKPLTQPVIWDRVRNQSLEPGMGLEGAKPYAGGANAQWFGQGASSYGGEFTIRTAKTPSGLHVHFEEQPTPQGPQTGVAFTRPGQGSKPGAGVPEEIQNPSVKQAIGDLGEVFRTVKDYVSMARPNSLEFTAASDSLMKVYDKVAPLMAKQLGGTFESPHPGEYIIRFTK